jgi:hypothetical protein
MPDEWLQRLTPGTLLARPSGEVVMVITCEVQTLPIGWIQLNFTTIGPSGLLRNSVEANTFDRTWKTLTS